MNNKASELAEDAIGQASGNLSLTQQIAAGTKGAVDIAIPANARNEPGLQHQTEKAATQQKAALRLDALLESAAANDYSEKRKLAVTASLSKDSRSRTTIKLSNHDPVPH